MMVRTQARWMRPGDRLVVTYVHGPPMLRCVVTEGSSTDVVVVSLLLANGETKNGRYDSSLVVNSAELLEWWREGTPVSWNQLGAPYWHPNLKEKKWQ